MTLHDPNDGGHRRRVHPATGAPEPLGDLVPRRSSDIRARSHVWAVTGVWAWQATLALVGAYPATALVRAAYGSHPRGDGPLGDPGAHALLAMLVRDAHGATAAASGAAIVGVLGAAAGLVPMAALMTAMAHSSRGEPRVGAARAFAGALRAGPGARDPSRGRGIGRGGHGRRSPWASPRPLEAAAHRWLGEGRGAVPPGRRAFGGPSSSALAAARWAWMHDLARAAVVKLRLRALHAWIVGARTFRARPFGMAWSWAWRSLASLAPVALVAAVADRVGWRGGWALALLAGAPPGGRR